LHDSTPCIPLADHLEQLAGGNQNRPAHGTKHCAQATLRPKDEGLQYGELFSCAAITEPEPRCRSHGFEGQ
jgi:hypothetical protein